MTALARIRRPQVGDLEHLGQPRSLAALARFKRAILFGASTGASEIEKTLARLNIETIAFADSNPDKQAQKFRGLPVVDPEVLPKLLDGETAIIIASAFQQEIAARLYKLGIAPFCIFPFVSPMFEGHFGPGAFDQIDESYTGLSARLADAASREYLKSLTAFRWSMNPLRITRNPQLRGFYDYDAPSLGPRPFDHVVDVGAYDGDSATAYLTRMGGRGRVSALEPLPQNLVRLAQTAAEHPMGSAIAIVPFAAGSQPASAFLDSEGDVDARATLRGKDGARTQIRVETLDRLFANDRVDFIKIDIEGFEPDALMGARAIINRDKPGLAIAAYHAPEHLWTLPALLDAICPGYRIYLGHHPAAAYECELFCVHEQRERV